MDHRKLEAGKWGFWWIALFVVYLLLIVKLEAQEVGAGVLMAAIAATAAWVSQRTGKLRFRPHIRWLRFAARLPARIAADCWILIGVLWNRLLRQRRRRGVVREIPFAPGGDGPVSRARRALVVAAVSLAPNTYVIGIDAERQVLIVHQLVRRKPSRTANREWPL